MKKSIRSIVLLSAFAVSSVPSFAAMGGGLPRPQWPAAPSALFSGMVAAASAFIGI